MNQDFGKDVSIFCSNEIQNESSTKLFNKETTDKTDFFK